MTDRPDDTEPPLGIDDPRISEWIDGRLTAAEAAEVEHAVRASTDLTALVADLRGMRDAMRAPVTDVPPVDLGDRIMAALLMSNGEVLPMGGASPGSANGSDCGIRRGRRLPWLGLAGALAAGVLVTVVVNLPRDDGREVALAPSEKPGVSAPMRTGKRNRELEVLEETEANKSMAGDRSEGARAVAADRERKDLRDAEAPAENVFPKSSSEDSSMKPDTDQHAAKLTNGIQGSWVGSEELRKKESANGLAQPEEQHLAMDDAATSERFAGGVGEGMARNFGSATLVPQSPAQEVAPLPGAAAAPVLEPQPPRAPAAESDQPADKAAERAASGGRRSEKRRQSELAGVIVVTVGSPSERRALDRLLAASGLDVTPVNDHLELVGAGTAVDDFLGELHKAGLVSSVPATRGQGAAKGKQDASREALPRSLVLRIVERKGKQSPAAQAGESERKP
jgi:hypothetical protein